MACPNDRPDRAIEMSEFPTARAATAHAHASGRRAVLMGGRNLVASALDAEWLETSGAVFAYLHAVHGRIVAVPVNG